MLCEPNGISAHAIAIRIWSNKMPWKCMLAILTRPARILGSPVLFMTCLVRASPPRFENCKQLNRVYRTANTAKNKHTCAMRMFRNTCIRNYEQSHAGMQRCVCRHVVDRRQLHIRHQQLTSSACFYQLALSSKLKRYKDNTC